MLKSMIKFKISFILFLLLSFSAFSKSDIKITAQEVFISLNIFEGEMDIIEYNLLTGKSGEEEISILVENLKDLVKETGYLNYRYGFNRFTSIQEKITNEGKYVKGSYKLVTSEKNIKECIMDVFSKILDRKVEVELNSEHIKLFFDGSGVNIADNNALGVFGGKNNRRMIIWRNGVEKLDMVVNFGVEEKKSINQYINKPITSPKKTSEEIDKIRYSSPQTKVSLQEFQDDADVYRLRHIKYYGSLLKEYKEKIGKYPFEGLSNIPIYVFIAHDRQESYAKELGKQNKNEHKVFAFKDFVKEIEKGLGRKIEQYFDPQYEPDIKPNFYIYLIKGKEYFFSVNVSKYYPFSRKVIDNYYKVEISNKSRSKSKIMKYEDLISMKSFEVESNNTAKKEAFFLEREANYIDYIK